MLRMFAVRVAIIVCVSSITAQIALSQALGSISGTMRDQTGKPVSGIWVTALRTSLPPARATAASSAGGGFNSAESAGRRLSGLCPVSDRAIS